MKALTIWQPWASLIMARAKPYEFRGWRAPRSIVGQRIVIHAAARRIDRSEVLDLSNLLLAAQLGGGHVAEQAAAETCLIREPASAVLSEALAFDLPMSAGLGTAILGEPRNGWEIAAEFGVARANDSDRDEHANWGWPLTSIEVWPEPIPMRGAQGFWNWPEPADALLLEQPGA